MINTVQVMARYLGRMVREGLFHLNRNLEPFSQESKCTGLAKKTLKSVNCMKTGHTGQICSPCFRALLPVKMVQIK